MHISRIDWYPCACRRVVMFCERKMKVIGQMQLIFVFLVLSVFVSDCYAISAETAEQTQKEQYQAEVNATQNSSQTRVRFGTKTGAKSKQSDESSNKSSSTTLRKAIQPTRNKNAKSNRVEPTSTQPSFSSLRSSSSLKQYTNKTLVSRRRHNSHKQVVVAQHEIPIVHELQAEYHTNSSSNDSVVSSHKRGQHKLLHSSRQPTESTANRVSRVSQTQSLGSRTSHSNIKDVHMTSNEVNNTKKVNGVTSRFVATSTSGRSSISTSTLTTSTSHPFLPSNFQISNPFDLIPQIFGNLSRAISPAASSRKPPKKYKSSVSTTPIPVISAQSEENQSYQKSEPEKEPLKATKLSIETYNVQSNDGPFRIALPTVNFFNPSIANEMKSDFEKEKGKRATIQSLRERFNCPRESEVRFQLFPKICKIDKDCRIWNRDELCCEIFGASSCVSGIPKPLEETSHMPIFGVIPRKCPTRPLAELWWDVQECETDNDCWPRVCCPDGRRRYCRTSQPELETVPVPVKRSFNYLTEYLECTAPPPPIFDLHPKACTSTFDCFPNVCCQEAGMRHCRPPKKSVLTLMANFFNVDFVKRLTQNIVIK